MFPVRCQKNVLGSGWATPRKKRFKMSKNVRVFCVVCAGFSNRTPSKPTSPATFPTPFDSTDPARVSQQHFWQTIPPPRPPSSSQQPFHKHVHRKTPPNLPNNVSNRTISHSALSGTHLNASLGPTTNAPNQLWHFYWASLILKCRGTL